jgi:aminoglycoside phosphotransferase (APT) family kinase protein
MLSIFAIRVWLGRKLFGTVGNSFSYMSGVKVSPSRMIKGPCHESEVEALRYVAAHTSIPVPKVYKTHQYRGHMYMELEFIQGTDLSEVWSQGTISPEQKRAIMHQIGGYIKELRALTPPKENFVASAELKEVFDRRIGQEPIGPFNSHDDFHTILRCRVPLNKSLHLFGELVKERHEQKYKTCFTHADLQLRNIIQRGGKVAAIIDWGNAGWYPEYWEYTKAHYLLWDIPDWWELLESEIPRYDAELAAERHLWKFFDTPEDELRVNFGSNYLTSSS